MNLDKTKEKIYNELPLTCKEKILDSANVLRSNLHLLYDDFKNKLNNQYYYSRDNNIIIHTYNVIKEDEFIYTITSNLFGSFLDISICNIELITYSKIKSIFNFNKIIYNKLELHEYIDEFYTFELADQKMIDFMIAHEEVKEMYEEVKELHEEVEELQEEQDLTLNLVNSL